MRSVDYEGLLVPRGVLAILFTCGLGVCLTLAACNPQPWAHTPWAQTPWETVMSPVTAATH